MSKKNNSRKLSLAIGFLALTTLPILAKEVASIPANCPSMKNAEQAVKVFMEADLRGGRLQSSSLDILAECFEIDDNNAWDQVRIAENLDTKACKRPTADCVRVKISILGAFYAGEKIAMRENSESIEFELKAQKKNDHWKISGLDTVAPMVSPKALLAFLQAQQKNNSEEWVGKSIESLKPLSEK